MKITKIISNEFAPCKSEMHENCIAVQLYDEEDKLVGYTLYYDIIKVLVCSCNCHKDV